MTSILEAAGWEKTEALRRSSRRMELGELGERAAGLAGVSVEELRSGSRRLPVVPARRALAQVAVGELGGPGAAVARYLGVATSTANRAVGRERLSALAKRLLDTLEGGSPG